MQKRNIIKYHEIHLCENSILSFSYIYYNAWILCGNSTDFELIYTSSISDLVNMQIYFYLLYSSSSFIFFTHILQGNNILDMTSHKFKERLEFTYFSPYTYLILRLLDLDLIRSRMILKFLRSL